MKVFNSSGSIKYVFISLIVLAATVLSALWVNSGT
ncbi:hypothetical protein BH20BAC1_BH20BAC1_05420 [soil metagenome]